LLLNSQDLEEDTRERIRVEINSTAGCSPPDEYAQHHYQALLLYDEIILQILLYKDRPFSEEVRRRQLILFVKGFILNQSRYPSMPFENYYLALRPWVQFDEVGDSWGAYPVIDQVTVLGTSILNAMKLSDGTIGDVWPLLTMVRGACGP
jgi:hypothetical protein